MNILLKTADEELMIFTENWKPLDSLRKANKNPLGVTDEQTILKWSSASR